MLRELRGTAVVEINVGQNARQRGCAGGLFVQLEQ